MNLDRINEDLFFGDSDDFAADIARQWSVPAVAAVGVILQRYFRYANHETGFAFLVAESVAIVQTLRAGQHVTEPMLRSGLLLYRGVRPVDVDAVIAELEALRPAAKPTALANPITPT